MKTHRELLDNYHEASWALAMECVAIRQGEEAKTLEERLDSDPAAAVPTSTVEHCKTAIRRAFRPSRAKRGRAILSKVLIAAILCGVMTSAACAISPDFRAFLVRVFYSVTQTFTSITLRDPKVEDVGAIQEDTVYICHGLRFEWIPDGYEYEDGGETSQIQWVNFRKEQSAYIRIRVIEYNSSFTYNYDSESGTVTEVTVGAFTGQLIEKEGQQSLCWVDSQKNKSVFILATDLPQEEFLQFAQGLIY